jgi:hypothetical protein
MVKIGLLIPCTSKKRPWLKMEDSYFYNLTLKTFLLTMDKSHQYVFYIGIDKNDPLFDNAKQQQKIQRYSKAFPHISFEFIIMKGVEKGHLTKMWNILFQKAYVDSCEYFFQCGDDIYFSTKGWINDCIQTLKLNNDVGLTGPINNNNRILTQAFVSRKHMEIFGWFFPEEIINWCCDDWYNWVYQPNHFFPLKQHFCSNMGGEPRYDIDNQKGFHTFMKDNVKKLREKTMKLASNHRLLIEKFLMSQ